MNTLSLMVTRRYPAGSGTLRTFGPHWSRHAATLLVNNGMPLEDIKRHVCHVDKAVAVTGRASRPPNKAERRVGAVRSRTWELPRLATEGIVFRLLTTHY